MARKARCDRLGLRVLALIAGGLALLVLASPNWRQLEAFRLRWVLSSNALAERGYERLLRGDHAEALSLFELAVARDPASPYRWCDYGEALWMLGQRERARLAIERGLTLGPYLGPIRMRGVNFGFQTGNQERALDDGRRLLEMTPAYDDAVFSVWKGMRLSAARIHAEGIAGARSGSSYLRWLMREQDTAAAQLTWQMVRDRRYADDKLADEYAGYLLRGGDIAAAKQAWQEYFRPRDSGYPDENMLFNGSFEREPAGSAFDWRIIPCAGAAAHRTTDDADRGAYALRIDFDGTANPAYRNTTQRVAIDPGGYELTARLRTVGVSTDEGIGLDVVDAERPTRLVANSERLAGTHGWRTLRVRVVVPNGTRLIEIAVARTPSLKFDSKLSGSVWVDSVRLAPARQSRAGGR